MRIARLQSAMEYLTTYGWSILLIAIVVAALYALGVFGGNPLASSNSCLPQSGFLCSKPILNSSGILNITFGQSYGTIFTITQVACTNSSSVPSSFVPISPTAIYAGTSTHIEFNCPITSSIIGTPFAGTLWIYYNTTKGNGETVKIGTVNLKVVTSSPQGGTGSGAQSLYPSLLSVPITLINTQSTATGSNFQEMLSINSNQYSSYINSVWSNVEFTTGNVAAGNVGAVLQAWVESGSTNTATNTIIWVNLPSGIPASSSTTVYMNMLAGNVMSASGPTGEAPQLSSTYAKYDNGAKVFLIYVNGNTNPSNFNTYAFMTVTQATGITYGSSTINALSLGGNSNSVYTLSIAYKNGIPAQSVIAESNFNKYNSLGASNGALGLSDSSTASPSANAIDIEVGYSAAYFGESYISSGTWGGLAHNQGSDSTGWNYAYMQSIPSNTNFYAYAAPQLYSTSGGYSGTVASNPISGASNIYLGFGVVATGGGWNMYINWARVRSYPPNGVTPSQNTGVAAPAGIVHYLPVTLTNSQSSATSSSFQANVLLNAGAYQVYEQSALQNIEFFYANGTIIPSWMEGNYLNEQQTTNLYTSNSIMYWVNIAPQIAASGGTQIVYAGFAGNTVNLLNTGTTGEAPQLSGTYAQYDNGANVFSNYWDFAGTSLPSTLAATNAVYSISNGLSITAFTSGGSISTGSAKFSTGNVIDFYGNPFNSNTIAGYYIGGLNGFAALNTNVASIVSYYADSIYGQQSNSGGASLTSSNLAITATLAVYSAFIQSSTTSSYSMNYGTQLSLASDAPTYPQAIGFSSGTETMSGLTGTVYWWRIRNYAPGGVQPGVTFGSFT